MIEFDEYVGEKLFDDWEILGFIRNYVCNICGGHLTQFPAGDRQWKARCCECNQDIGLHNFCHRKQWAKVNADRIAARIEIRAAINKSKSADESKRELGF